MRWEGGENKKSKFEPREGKYSIQVVLYVIDTITSSIIVL